MEGAKACPRCGRDLRTRAHGFVVCRGCSRPPDACECDPLPPANLDKYVEA